MSRQRDVVFISHANPEDNDFTIWLGSRLSAAGFKVWADVLNLRGGQDWQQRLESVLRDCACKLLFVGTPRSVKKRGVRNELQIASDVGARIDDPEFIIPLRLERYDPPFVVAHAQYIDFSRGWAPGLLELEAVLQPFKAERGQLTPAWSAVHLRHSKEVRGTPERLVSNWVRTKPLPDTLYYYEMKSSASVPNRAGLASRPTWPILPYGSGFLAFATPETVSADPTFSGVGPFKRVHVETFLRSGSGRPEAVASLLNGSIEMFLKEKGLAEYEMSSGKARWVPEGGPSGLVPFEWGEWAGRRQLQGESGVRKVRWHFGVSPRVRLHPPHVRFAMRLIFTSDGQTPLGDEKRMHRLRRSFAKSWRNDRWREMLLAFLSWLGDGATTVEIPLGGPSVTLELPPLSWSSPVSVDDATAGDGVEDGEEESDDQWIHEELADLSWDEELDHES